MTAHEVQATLYSTWQYMRSIAFLHIWLSSL